MSTNLPVVKATKTRSRTAARIGGALAAAGLLTALGAGPAFAHVHADSTDATKGGYGKITFRVPNEEDNAGTIKLQVTFPSDHLVGGASVKPVPGWTATVDTKKLAKPVQQGENQLDEAVTKITWTAKQGTRINPGEFQEFDVSAGPLPSDTDTLVLPAVQTYDNGDVVRWEQETKPGQPEPERPAPSLELAAAESEGSHHGTAAASAEGGEHGAHGDQQAAAEGTDDTARWLGGAGLVVGALGLGVGAGALLRARKSNRTGA